MALFTAVLLALHGTWCVWNAAALGACWFVLRRRGSAPPGAVPPLTVLKPLAGADPDLERCLESFFRQTHTEYQILFGVRGSDDPAIPVVRRVLARHSGAHATLIVHDGATTRNPKVENLLQLLPYARHDLLLVSDSNVLAPPGYLREAVATHREQGGGLVTHLFVGSHAGSVGARLDATELASVCAPAVALGSLAGEALVVGKSMLFSRAELDRLGGLARVADLLAEDWVLGRTFQHAGRPVTLGRTLLETPLGRLSARAFLARHRRWAMLRWRLAPVALSLEILCNPLLLALGLACALGGLAGLWVLAAALLRDLGAWGILRGRSQIWLPAVLLLPRELLALVARLDAPFRRHVAWRGHRFRLGAGTLLYQAAAVRRRPLAARRDEGGPFLSCSFR